MDLVPLIHISPFLLEGLKALDHIYWNSFFSGSLDICHILSLTFSLLFCCLLSEILRSQRYSPNHKWLHTHDKITDCISTLESQGNHFLSIPELLLWPPSILIPVGTYYKPCHVLINPFPGLSKPWTYISIPHSTGNAKWMGYASSSTHMVTFHAAQVSRESSWGP